jgi:FkbM family methyltransferase
MWHLRFYKLLNLTRKVIPYCTAYMATLNDKDKSAKWTIYWEHSCSSIYGSFLGKIKLKVLLPTGHNAIIRPFSQDGSVLSELFRLKPYFLMHQPSRGNVVIDAGANIGIFSIIASNLVGSEGLVVSIEPLPENYQILKQNIELNSLENVFPIKAALGNENGAVNLYLDKGKSTVSSITEKSETYLTVPQITLEELLKKFNIDIVDFIKMDIEGAEAAVIKAGQGTLMRCKPFLAIEVHKSNPSWESMLIQLQEMNFEVIEKKYGALDFVYARPLNS